MVWCGNKIPKNAYRALALLSFELFCYFCIYLFFGLTVPWLGFCNSLRDLNVLEIYIKTGFIVGT